MRPSILKSELYSIARISVLLSSSSGSAVITTLGFAT